MCCLASPPLQRVLGAEGKRSGCMIRLFVRRIECPPPPKKHHNCVQRTCPVFGRVFFFLQSGLNYPGDRILQVMCS